MPSRPITRDQAQAIADGWSPTGRAVLYEFDLGYMVFDVSPEPEDPTRPPANVGGGRGVIDKETGELSVWPSMPPDVVARMYRDHRGGPGPSGSGIGPGDR